MGKQPQWLVRPSQLQATLEGTHSQLRFFSPSGEATGILPSSAYRTVGVAISPLDAVEKLVTSGTGPWASLPAACNAASVTIDD